MIDFFNFVRDNWDKIILVITTVWTLVQNFQIQVLKKK